MPDAVVRRLVGCWRLSPISRVVFSVTATHGLAAQQWVEGRPPVVTVVRYSATNGVLDTPLVGTHHGGTLVFRPAGHAQIDVSFVSRTLGASPWQHAHRCE